MTNKACKRIEPVFVWCLPFIVVLLLLPYDWYNIYNDNPIWSKPDAGYILIISHGLWLLTQIIGILITNKIGNKIIFLILIIMPIISGLGYTLLTYEYHDGYLIEWIILIIDIGITWPTIQYYYILSREGVYKYNKCRTIMIIYLIIAVLINCFNDVYVYPYYNHHYIDGLPYYISLITLTLFTIGIVFIAICCQFKRNAILFIWIILVIVTLVLAYFAEQKSIERFIPFNDVALKRALFFNSIANNIAVVGTNGLLLLQVLLIPDNISQYDFKYHQTHVRSATETDTDTDWKEDTLL